MEVVLTGNELVELVSRQLKSSFILSNEEADCLHSVIDAVIQRCSICFSKCRNKYYSKDEKTIFNPFHSGQYTIFLYWLSRTIFLNYRDRCSSLCDRIYYLNRMLNGIDLFYEIDMPNYFMLEHPLGSVLGRAVYANGFTFSQQCTVGGSKGIYPVLGTNVILFSGAKVLGNSRIGNNVLISANTYVLDLEIPDYSLIFGRPRDYVIKSIDEEYFSDFRSFDLLD